MSGEKAFDLIMELKRSTDPLPPFNEDGVRQVVEEMKMLYEQNAKDVGNIANGELGRYACGINLRHVILHRNQRCLLAYVYNRQETIRQMRWEIGSVLPPEIKYNLCEAELEWFQQYNRNLARYMRSVTGEFSSLDLTEDLKPPKSLYIEVRCLVDFGDFEADDGRVVALTKNTRHFLLRSQCEHLIRQGILEHVLS